MKAKLIISSLLICAGSFCLFITSAYGQMTNKWNKVYYNQDKISPTGLYEIIGDKLQFDNSNNCYFISVFDTAYKPVQHQLIKYSSTGTTLWVQRDTTVNVSPYSGLEPQKLLVTPNGTSYSVSNDYDNYNNSLAVVTADSTNGSFLWRNPQQNPDFFTNIALDNSGNIGATTSYGYAGYLNLTKISPSGATIWSVQHYSSDGYGYSGGIEKVATDKDNNFYVLCPNFHGYPYNKSFLQLIKFNSSGVFQWENAVDSSVINGIDLIYNNKDNSLYLSYEKFLAYPTRDSAKVTKVNTNGQVVWMRVESIPEEHNFTVFKKDVQGNVYCWTNFYEYGLLDPGSGGTVLTGNVTKYDTSGNILGRMKGFSFDVDSKGYTYTTNNFYKPYKNYRSIRKYSPSGALLYDYPDTTASYYYSTSEVFTDKADDIYTLNNELNILVRKFSTTCNAKAAPAKPKSITGSAAMYCDNSNYSYSCPAVANAIYYNWTVPTGVVIDSGQGTTKLYVHHYIGFKTGQISVYASNCFGASAAATKAVTDTLKPSAKITGATSVCKGQQNVQYTAQAVVGAISYQWIIPADAAFTSGYAISGLTVHINFGNTSGKISVVAESDCDTSAAKSLQVKVTACASGMITAVSEDNKTVVYPNPSSSSFTLRLGDADKTFGQPAWIIVKDVSGKVVEQLKNVTSGSVSFGSRLMPGVYFVEVITGNEKQVLKVVKE